MATLKQNSRENKGKGAVKKAKSLKQRRTDGFYTEGPSFVLKLACNENLNQFLYYTKTGSFTNTYSRLFGHL